MMRPDLEAHYLDIEWREYGRVRQLRASPEPIEIETAPDGRMSAELQIFHDMHPWLGLRVRGALAQEEPAFITSEGRRQPMLAIEDGENGTWWVQNDGWDPVKKRHLSELHRTMGRFEIEVGARSLFIENIASDLRRSNLEEYLRDFQQDLIWLVMGFGSATATTGDASGHAELLAAVSEFSTAAHRVIGNPGRAIREVTAETRISRLRPNAATFRQYARTPAAQRLVGRLPEETADIPDNRYMRHMVQICGELACKVAASAKRQADNLAAWAEMEGERSAAYRNMESRPVDPDIFDIQLSELNTRLNNIEAFTYESGNNGNKEGNYQVEIGKNFTTDKNKFFFKKLNGTSESDEAHNIKYNVIDLPFELACQLSASKSFSKSYTITGSANIRRLSDKSDNNYRHLSFDRITSITCHTQALADKHKKRDRLERDNWIVRLSRQDREEMDQEARTAELRERVYLRQATQAASTAGTLSALGVELKRLDRAWKAAGVTTTPLLPTGMRYHMSPEYASCLAAFTRVTGSSGRGGIGAAALEAIDSIGVLHASAMYERWCLIKIISVLIQDYGFVPESNWQDQLIRSVTGRPESLALRFHREDLAMIATLESQPLLPNGRRPDFRLIFSDGRPSGTESGSERTGLVLDAKFRTTWRTGELASVLDDLVSSKNYGQEGDRVFILQPAASAVARPTSPLGWGRDCDFGHTHPRNHRQGWIHLAPARGVASPVAHLRRLIALELQHTFSPPETTGDDIDVWKSNSICIRCGKRHGAQDVTPKQTRAKKPYWNLRCTECETTTVRTHCFECGRILFKNGVHFTYHLTLADQITNARCPCCGEYFDSDWRTLSESRPDRDPGYRNPRADPP